MKKECPDLSERPASLLRALVEELERGRELLFELDDVTFSEPQKLTGSIGEHFRHNLNFIDAFLEGVRVGVIDYAARIRDRRVETDRLHAAAKLREAVSDLENVPLRKMQSDVEVVSELDRSLRHRSTISRELEFVQSHTVHHHALIRQKLAGSGVEPETKFGVAPSTLEYWSRIMA